MWAFPTSIGGLAASERTTAEVLSKAGYATAFYGKAHIGDIEPSYMTNQGFDEALWTPYNQVPSLYTPQGQMAALGACRPVPGDVRQGPLRHGSGWRPNGYVFALEGTKKRTRARVGRAPNHDDYMKLDPEMSETDHRVHPQERSGEKAVLCRLLADRDLLPWLSEPSDRERRVAARGARAARCLDRRP